MELDSLPLGKAATITSVGGEGALRQHFLDMGLIPGADVQLVKFAPSGDPMEVRVHSYELSLRKADAHEIGIDQVREAKAEQSKAPHTYIDHPGYGEELGPKPAGAPLSEGTLLTFALVGNQNSGKTTLFNQLTGSNQHVGNFPGVTVDRKDGVIRGHEDTRVTDLPGIYSMSPYSDEELVTRRFILQEHPRAIINIIDATAIERNLYLTMQLMQLDVPMVLALNMMDEVRESGGTIHVNALEKLLGIPVVPISAAKNEGVDELIDHALHVARYQEKPGRTDFCAPNEDGGAVHRALHAVMHLVEDHAQRAGLPIRFVGDKLIEGDHLVIDALGLDENEKEMIEHIIKQMESERGLDRAAAIADMRYDFIRRVTSDTVVHTHASPSRVRSEKIDRTLTGKYSAIPMFILIMCLVFYLTFGLAGPFLQDLIASGVDALSKITDHAMVAGGVNPVIRSLVIDGVFTGVGSVISFLPLIVILYFFLSLLEDSGYMARVAFIMDSLLRKVGLSGRSIVPLLLGFGCSVPAVMASRTLSSERDRKMTILLIPFISCSAKLPIYGYMAHMFFPRHSGAVMVGLYLLGIVLGIVMAVVLKLTSFKGEAVPFVMELPNYRMPSARNTLMLVWEKAKDFLVRAFTVIFVATLVIWFLQTFGTHFQVVEDSSQSLLAAIASGLAPVFRPLGFGDWRIASSLISGFMAKETLVATMEVLFPSGSLAALLTSAGALSLLVFSLLYTPCVAAVTTIKRELSTGWALYVVLAQCVFGWLMAFVCYHIALLVL